MASEPELTSSHRSSGEAMPPGYRQAMPTIATGSSETTRDTGSGVPSVGWPSRSCSSSTTASGVGWL